MPIHTKVATVVIAVAATAIGFVTPASSAESDGISEPGSRFVVGDVRP